MNQQVTRFLQKCSISLSLYFWLDFVIKWKDIATSVIWKSFLIYVQQMFDKSIG